ncbi:MAG: endo-1,4-beta-xylanase [Siculibacillus sp.]
MRRRDVLKAMAGGVAASAFGGGAANAEIARIGQVAAQAGITFGTAFDAGALDIESYKKLIETHARILTTDYSMKFGPLRPNGPEANFTATDRMVAFAEKAGLPIRGHTLIWNEGNPTWLAKLSSERRSYWLDKHITEVMDHYYGRMHSWDVVNEPFWPDHGHKGGFRNGPWYEAMGPDYIYRAFARAQKVEPGVKLVLNEAFTESATPLGLAVRQNLLRLVDEIKHRGLRLDAVGLQGHIRAFNPLDADGWRRFLSDLAARGVEIYITEVDVDDRMFKGTDAERDAQCATVWRRLIDTALDEPKVTTIITWELADRYSSYVDEYGPTTRPLPFDRDLKPKPAYDALIAALRAKKRG